MELQLPILVICAFVCAVLGYTDETYRCPANIPVNKFVRTHGNSCYQFVRGEKSWYGAYDDCRSKRGHLVTIRTKATQDFIMSSLRSFHWPGNGVWLGASDRQKEMDWKWVTNDRVKYGYQNWAPGQPSCHIFCFEDCAQLRLDEGGTWHDYKCSWVEDYSYICEFPLRPKTTTTTSTTTTTTSTTPTTTTPTSTTTTTASTTTSMRNTTRNDTVMLMKMAPDVKVEMIGNSRMSKLEHQEESSNSTISIVVLVLGVVCGLILGLCIGIFVFRRKNRKDQEEEPSVFFSNPYYGDVRAPLNPPPPANDSADIGCCAGGTSYSQAPTPVKRPLCGPPLPKRAQNIYNPTPTLKSHGSFDDITAQKLLYAAQSGDSNPAREEDGAVGGVYEDADLVDNHYDYSTGENFYETVDNVRLAIQQNALNEQQEEERYVPFQFDSPDPEKEEN